MINDLLKRIKEAIYGEEVRGSIHDAIEQCYKDAVGHPESVAATVKEIGEVSANLSKETADRKAEVSTERKRIDNLIATGTAQTQEIGKVIATTSKNGTEVTMNYLAADVVYDKMFNNMTFSNPDFFVVPYPQRGYVAKVSKAGLYHMKFCVAIGKNGGLPEVAMRIELRSSNSLDGDYTELKTEYFVFPQTSSPKSMRNVEYIFAITEPTYIKLFVTSIADGTGTFDFKASDCTITAIDWKGKQSADLSELHDLRIGADSTVYGTAGEAVRKQIGNLTEDLTSKADKTSLAQTDRKLDALWKLNQGISYEFQTEDTEAYQKTVPSGAKMASVKSIGGKTIVWNQLITKQNESEHNYGLDFTWLDNGKIKISGTSTYTDGDANVYTILNSIEATADHKYLFKLTGTDSFYILGYGIRESTAQTQKLIFEPQDSGTENLAICGIKEKIQSGTVIDDVVCPQIFDLTQMFGSGNEPSSPEEFEAMFPADYYPYNAGELMSAPVNEIVEQGRNLFDCYGFSCTGIPNINAKRDIANDYGTTISTIDSTNRLIVTQNKVDDSVGYSYKNGYFCIGIRGLKCNTKYELAFDFTPTKILIANPVMKIFVNGNPDFGEGSSGVEFSLNVKKHVTIKFTYKMNNDMQFLELRNAGMSGIIENFQIEEGTTVATYSPYHQNTYSIHKAIIDLDGYGWSAGNVRNEVDWENKQYIQRVGKYTIDGSEIIFKENKYWVMTVTDFEKPRPLTKNAICVNFKVTDVYSGKWGSIIFRQESDGFVFTDIGSKFANKNEVKDYFQQNNETIYYELNEEQIIDISDIIDNTFREPIEVEAGGTLTLKNSHGDDYRIPVPNSEEYVISLAEVAK